MYGERSREGRKQEAGSQKPEVRSWTSSVTFAAPFRAFGRFETGIRTYGGGGTDAELLVFEFLVGVFGDQERHAGLMNFVFPRFGFGVTVIGGVFIALFLFLRFEANFLFKLLRSEG